MSSELKSHRIPCILHAFAVKIGYKARQNDIRQMTKYAIIRQPTSRSDQTGWRCEQSHATHPRQRLDGDTQRSARGAGDQLVAGAVIQKSVKIGYVADGKRLRYQNLIECGSI